MPSPRTITSDPNRLANTKALTDSLDKHRDADRTKEVVGQAPGAGSVQGDLDAFRSYHHEQALSDVAADATGTSRADNDYLDAVENLNGLYETAASDGELSVDEQDELLTAADDVSEAEMASRDVFFVDGDHDHVHGDHDHVHGDHDHVHGDHDHDTLDVLAGVNAPLNPNDVSGSFPYVAAPTAEQIGAGAPLGFGHDNDGNNMVVSDVQQQLFDGGHYGDGATAEEVDGFYGPKTQAAVEAFQTEHGLEVTGQIGQDDLVALGLAEPTESNATEVAEEPSEILRTDSGRVIPGSLPTPSLEDGAPEVVELRGGSADNLHRRGEQLQAQGYVTDNMGTYYHPDVALEHPDLTFTVGSAAGGNPELHADLTGRGYIYDGEQTYHHPATAHLIPGSVVDLSNVPDGIARAEGPELRRQGYLSAGDGVFVDPSLKVELQGSPAAAEQRAEELTAQGWLNDGMGTYYHPGVAQHFLG